MNGKFVLDTNVAIGVINRQADIVSFVSDLEDTFLSTIVLGELVFGAVRSSRKEENLKRIEGFTNASKILNVDSPTARCFGELKQRLFVAGTPIPSNDIWIAATAIRHGFGVATLDRHFSQVSGLIVTAPNA